MTSDAITKWVIGCMECMINCIEKLIQFFNRHSYIETVLCGTSYCPSTIKAMKVIVLNVARFGILHGICEIVMFFSTLFLVSLTVVASYFFMKYTGREIVISTPLVAPILVRNKKLT